MIPPPPRPPPQLTVYLGRRDFVDHVTEVDPVDGVVLIDPDYFSKEGKTDRKGEAAALVEALCSVFCCGISSCFFLSIIMLLHARYIDLMTHKRI